MHVQTHCAHCNTTIEKDRCGEILCLACETAWWAKFQGAYRTVIQKVINRQY